MKLTKKQLLNIIEISIVCLSVIFTIVTNFIKIKYSSNALHDNFLKKIIPYTLVSIATVIIIKRLNIKIFKKIENIVYVIPCLIVAVNNMQWHAFFSGKMHLANTQFLDVLLFVLYCLSIGFVEELVFRGLCFSLIASFFPKNKKGIILTFFSSSVIFGLMHFFNGFSLGTLKQVGYSILTGGLFAFCLMKTKNIFCPILLHSVYNFCGLLFDTQGLGSGVVFDLGTIISMLVVDVLIGVFIIIKTFTYPEPERTKLYDKLGISNYPNIYLHHH